MTVVKRDGEEVSFNPEKIFIAIKKANESAGNLMSEVAIKKIATSITKEAEELNRPFGVEEIQDKVEQKLMKVSYDVAKKYILYRDFRSKERSKKEKITKEIKAKLDCKKVERQNANVDEYSFGGRKGEASSVQNKQMALDYYLSDKVVKNHIENRVYQHDLDSHVVGMSNCLVLPFDELLSNGFTVKQTDVRPAKSVSTAFQLVAVIFQVQSLQQFGGVSASHLDWTMVPYVRRSFFKHYLMAYLKSTKEFYKFNLLDLGDEELDDWVDLNKEKYLRKFNLTLEDFTFDNKNLKKRKRRKFRQCALFDTIIETKQAVEGIYHNLNTLQSRSGNQLPFTSINYGTCTLPEGRMIIEALLKGLLKGVGRLHRTPIFPCGIFQKMKGVNDEGSPNYYLYELALKATSKRLYPNYANCDWSNDTDLFDIGTKNEFLNSLNEEQKKMLLILLSGNSKYQNMFGLEIKEDEVVPKEFIPSCIPSTMGCRTYTSKDINWEEEWKSELLKWIDNPDYKPNTFASSHQKDGRGNIVPATVIMPTYAMEAKEAVEKNPDLDLIDTFFQHLEEGIEDCKDSLLERFDWICSQPEDSAKFMWDNGTFVSYKPEEGLRSAFKHGSLALGQIGLAETLQILIGKNHLEPEGMELAKRIETLFSTKCKYYKEHYKLNFGVYYTPAENLCYTSMKKFKERFGVIENVSDRDYFTNSIHVPVWEEIGPFEKIEVESQLTGFSTAGCITYIELDSNASHNLDALKQLVDKAMELDIPYFAINVPSDTCLCCGYQGEIENECPECGEESLIERLRRVTGYLTGNFLTAFNPGKIAEALDRFKHSKLFSGWKR